MILRKKTSSTLAAAAAGAVRRHALVVLTALALASCGAERERTRAASADERGNDRGAVGPTDGRQSDAALIRALDALDKPANRARLDAEFPPVRTSLGEKQNRSVEIEVIKAYDHKNDPFLGSRVDYCRMFVRIKRQVSPGKGNAFDRIIDYAIKNRVVYEEVFVYGNLNTARADKQNCRAIATRKRPAGQGPQGPVLAKLRLYYKLADLAGFEGLSDKEKVRLLRLATFPTSFSW